MSRLTNFWVKFREFDFNRVIIILSVVILVLALYSNYLRGKEIEVAGKLNTSLNDTIIFWKTREGHHKAKISVLESRNTRDFVKLSTKDTTINKLQKLVKENEKYLKKQGSVSIIEMETKLDTVIKSIVNNNIKLEPSGDSPIYTAPIKMGKWINGETVASRDSTHIRISFKNEIQSIIGTEKTGFLGLGKRKTFTETTLLNPFSEVKTIRTYQKQSAPTKKIHIGPTLMYGIGQNVQPGVYIGIGATWGVINF